MHHHLLGFVSQNLAEQAKAQLPDYAKQTEVLDLPTAWTVEFYTEDRLDPNVQQILIEQLHPMIPIFNGE